jgi:uncharacterized membrane protein
MLLRGRPIAVSAIFGYSVIVIAMAMSAVVGIGLAQPGTPNSVLRDEYGTLGLFVSIVPASVLFLSGLSLFLLRRWTIWFWALTVLIMMSGAYLGPSVTLTNLFWSAVALAAFAYVIWLRRSGVLR